MKSRFFPCVVVLVLHYNGSARFYYSAGEAFGRAMLEQVENQKK